MFGSAPEAFTPTLWIGDAASALVAALDRAPSGLYDVVDDEPVRQRQLKTALAAAAGRRRMLSLPVWLVRMMAGPAGGGVHEKPAYLQSPLPRGDRVGATSPRCHRGHGAGRRRKSSRPDSRVPLAVRSGLWAMALLSLLAGMLQQFAPRSFFDNFPGFGMQWVAVDGPYNEHLLRDLGGANLSLGVIILYAIARPTVEVVRAVAAAILVAQVPHFIYHAAHLEVLPTALDRVLQTASLALTLAIPLLVLLRAGGIRQEHEATSAQPAGFALRAEQHNSNHGWSYPRR